MELREFQPGESSDIQQIARESLTASYGGAFDEALVEDLVAQWYNEETVEQLVDDENALLVVAATDEAVGYAQGEIIGTDPVIGDVQWLHVRPDARGERVGVQLLGDLVDRMESRGASLVRGRANTVSIPPKAKFHQIQLPAIPSEATISVTRSGVSAAKVVATIEVPANHHGMSRPERKNSEVSFEARR